MPLTNSTTRYGSVARALHWLTALLILTLIPLGLVANWLPYDTTDELARKARLFSLHKTLGVTLFAVALIRIVWSLTQPKPAPLHPERRFETVLADTVHWLLYGSLVLVPLTGWIGHAAQEGFAPILLPVGQTLPFVPRSETVAATAASLHVLFGRVLALAILLHVVGALKHHVMDQDATLGRMWSGTVTGGAKPRSRGRLAPLAGAIAAWGLALVIGASLGTFDRQPGQFATTPLAEVASDWRLDSGTLAITVNQFGSDVTGTFADWTAAISFDETAEGDMGNVEITISIASLTLGSVTDEVMKPEYFDLANHPAARFTASIRRDESGYVATGALTLKGTTVPVTLPFTLAIEGNRATMAGTVTLDRRDFGIGGESESAVRHPVRVSVELEATRSP
ncbi:MAG: cytochrome b/b6 domain-containing protein [Silicimonas sp.]|nr:cytochrome b/b6 domain-containing protein [Silicimonas sp.]